MPTNFLQLLEQAKTELIADIESGKINLKEYATGELDKYNEIADEYSNPEISKILQKWDNLGFDTEGEAVNAILQDKNWKNSFDVSNEDASDIQKVSTWRSQITSKKLGEARTFKVNPKYAYFAVGKSDNKIVTGWEIVDDVESLKYHAKSDLKDMDLNPSDYKLLSKNALIKQGIDPFNWNNWRKTEGSSTLNEAGETIIQSTTGDDKDLQAKMAAAAALKRGDQVRIVKKGLTTLEEKKKKEQPEEEEAPAEETEDQPENVEGEQSTSTPDTISAELEQQIKQAVDSAAEFIKSIDDKKYETALGKVIKNLTMAQAALAAVKERETKLSEEAGVIRDKSMEKYIAVFKKRLKKVIKDEALIQKIIKIYKSVIEKSHDKNVPAEKMTEQVWKHFTLHEGVQKKAGVVLTEMATGDQDLDNLTDFVRGPISNSKFRTIEKDIDIVRNGKNLVLTYTVDGKPQELPTDALGALQAKSIYTIEKTPDNKYKITVAPGEKKDIGRAFEKLKKNLSEDYSTTFDDKSRVLVGKKIGNSEIKDITWEPSGFNVLLKDTPDSANKFCGIYYNNYYDNLGTTNDSPIKDLTKLDDNSKRTILALVKMRNRKTTMTPEKLNISNDEDLSEDSTSQSSDKTKNYVAIGWGSPYRISLNNKKVGDLQHVGIFRFQNRDSIQKYKKRYEYMEGEYGVGDVSVPLSAEDINKYRLNGYIIDEKDPLYDYDPSIYR